MQFWGTFSPKYPSSRLSGQTVKTLVFPGDVREPEICPRSGTVVQFAIERQNGKNTGVSTRRA
jgi:hypothetical protein